MGRENCMMCEELSGKIYCGYYDFAVMLCEENLDCPEKLDEDDEDEITEEDIENWLEDQKEKGL
jgi:hypothetical protein